MAKVGVCWLCGDRLYDSDVKLVRAKKAECAWVIKRVCCPCQQRTVLFTDVIEEIDGEFWTLRAWRVGVGT